MLNIKQNGFIGSHIPFLLYPEDQLLACCNICLLRVECSRLVTEPFGDWFPGLLGFLGWGSDPCLVTVHYMTSHYITLLNNYITLKVAKVGLWPLLVPGFNSDHCACSEDHGEFLLCQVQAGNNQASVWFSNQPNLSGPESSQSTLAELHFWTLVASLYN